MKSFQIEYIDFYCMYKARIKRNTFSDLICSFQVIIVMQIPQRTMWSTLNAKRSSLTETQP